MAIIGNEKVQKLMNTPMSRKQFLRYMGIIALSLMGVGNVITALLKGRHTATKQPELKQRNGFGGGKYGV